MRILLCLHASPAHRSAGVEVYSDALARSLSANHEVALLYPEGRAVSTATDDSDDRIRHFVVDDTRAPRSFAETYRDPRRHREIESVLDTYRPDIVHVQHLMGLSSELPAAAQARGIPVVMTVHDYWMQCAAGGQRFHPRLGRCDEVTPDRCADCTAHKSGPAMRVNAELARFGMRQSAPTGGDAGEARGRRLVANVVRRVASRATRARPRVQRDRIQERWDTLLSMSREVDQFIVPSRFMQSEMVQFGLPAAAIDHIELGIASQHHGARRDLPETARHIGYLGGITKHKGVHALIEAASGLPGEIRFTIWGDEGDDPAYAKRLHEIATHPGITFAGKLAQHEVPKQLREIDTLVVPSLWHENAPLVVREAFSAGVPVVAARLGGLPELLDGGGGLLYDADTPGELERCLVRLTGEPGLARHLVEKRPPVKTMDQHALEVSAIYRGLASEFDNDTSS